MSVVGPSDWFCSWDHEARKFFLSKESFEVEVYIIRSFYAFVQGQGGYGCFDYQSACLTQFEINRHNQENGKGDGESKEDNHIPVETADTNFSILFEWLAHHIRNAKETQ